MNLFGSRPSSSHARIRTFHPVRWAAAMARLVFAGGQSEVHRVQPENASRGVLPESRIANVPLSTVI